MIFFSNMKIINHLIIVDKKEHKITARERKLSKLVYFILLLVIIYHWQQDKSINSRLLFFITNLSKTVY